MILTPLLLFYLAEFSNKFISFYRRINDLDPHVDNSKVIQYAFFNALQILAVLSAIPIMRKFKMRSLVWTGPIILCLVGLTIACAYQILIWTKSIQTIRLTSLHSMIAHVMFFLAITPGLVNARVWLLLLYIFQETIVYLLRIGFKIHESEYDEKPRSKEIAKDLILPQLIAIIVLPILEILR